MKRAVLVSLLALLAAAPAGAQPVYDTYPGFIRVIKVDLELVKSARHLSDSDFNSALLAVLAWVHIHHCSGSATDLREGADAPVDKAVPDSRYGEALLEMLAVVLRLQAGQEKHEEFRCRFALATALELQRQN